jgi:two-component system nitrate/nitrite sensor histidine kinase NarX
MENSGLRIQLGYQLEHCPLTPNEEIHCLQIVREALSNVLKHAQAAHCWLVLHQAEDGNIEVLIDDDGIGIRHSESPSGHYGLSILKERASSLGGQLEIVPRTAGGTRVQLHFTPSFRKIPLHQETA